MSTPREAAARAVLARVPFGYGMTVVEAQEYANAAIDAFLSASVPADVAGVIERLKARRVSGKWSDTLKADPLDQEAATALQSLSAQVAELTRERDEAFAANERDRSIITDARATFRNALERRSWLLNGRGSYEWDDDRWKGEFAEAIKELGAPMEVLGKLGVDWSLCPTSPDEIAAARIDWKARAEAAERERDIAQKQVIDAWNALGGPKAETAEDVETFSEIAEGDVAEQVRSLKKSEAEAIARAEAAEVQAASYREECERLREALGHISRMTTLPDHAANTTTLLAAHQITRAALSNGGKEDGE